MLHFEYHFFFFFFFWLITSTDNCDELESYASVLQALLDVTADGLSFSSNIRPNTLIPMAPIGAVTKIESTAIINVTSA